jgi:hypothetical protein
MDGGLLCGVAASNGKSGNAAFICISEPECRQQLTGFAVFIFRKLFAMFLHNRTPNDETIGDPLGMRGVAPIHGQVSGCLL